MSKDLNLCQFIGRLGQDPEIRHMPNGDPVANTSIAVGDDYKDKNSGQKVEQTEWVRVTFFRGLAEVVGKYLNKGSRIYVSGKMKTRKYQGQDGQDRYTTEIVANEMQMLDSRESSNSRPQTSNQTQTNSHQSGGSGGGMSDFDDVPFAPLGREHFV